MEEEKRSTVIIFFINGINSLLGWSVVLAAFDFFAGSFKDYNVYSFLPVPLFVGYIIIGVIYHSISTRFKYVNLIIAGNLIVNIALVFILIFSLSLAQTPIGFVLILACSFMIGIGANISQLTFFAMINYLSQNVVSKFTVGTAVSGLFITSIRAVLTAAFGADNDSHIPIIIYFVIGIGFNTFDLLMNIKFCRSQVFKAKIDPFITHQVGRHESETTIENDSSINEPLKPNDKKSYADELASQQMQEKSRIENQNYFKTLYEATFKIFPYPFIIMFTFVITFTLFPGPTFSKTFPNLEITWSTIIFNLVYALGDTIGKYSAEIKNIFNPKSLVFIFFGRLFFFFTITFLATGADEGDALTDNYFFPFFNQLLFAITNGFCINASFIMAFIVCPQAYKKYAGVLCGLLLQVGIILGTIIEIPYSYIIGIN